MATEAHRQLRLRTALLIALLVAVLPALLIQLGIFYYWLRTGREHTVQSNMELSRALATTFDDYVRSVGQHEAVLAAAFTAKNELLSPEQMTPLLEASTTDYPSINVFLFARADGAVVACSDKTVVGVNIKDRWYFQRAIVTKDHVLSDLLEGRAHPDPIVVIARAVYNGEKVEGVVAAVIEPNRLGEATLRVSRAEEAGISLFDRQGQLVYRSAARKLTPEDRQATRACAPVIQALAGQEAGERFRWPGEDQDRLGAAVPIKSLGWVALASEPAHVVTDPMAKTMLLVATINSLVLLASIIVALALSRAVGVNFVRLGRHALAAGEGDFQPLSLSTRISEVQDLTAAFNKMIAGIKQGEVDLRKSEEKFRVLVEESPVALVMVDRAGTISLVNAQGERLFGYTRQELIGQRVEILLPPQFKGGHAALREGFIAHPSARPMGAGRDLFGIRKDGRQVPIEIALTPVDTLGGLFVVATITDITARKQAEEGLRQADQLKADFIRIASHELRTPISYILGMTHLLSQIDDPARLEAALPVIEAKARRLSDLILAMFKLLPGELGSEPLRYSPVSLTALIHDVGAELQPFLDARHQQLVSEIPSSPTPDTRPPSPALDDLTIQADRNKLRDVLENLVMNAIKFTPDGGRIHVSAGRTGVGGRGSGVGVQGSGTVFSSDPRPPTPDPRVFFSVRDEGAGIAAEDLPHLFKPFFNGGNVLQHSTGVWQYGKSGVGLGLTIVKQFVEMHGGKITVDTSPKGSVFTVTLPVDPPGPSGRGAGVGVQSKYAHVGIAAGI